MVEMQRLPSLGNQRPGAIFLYNEKSKVLLINPILKNKFDFGFLLV